MLSLPMTFKTHDYNIHEGDELTIFKLCGSNYCVSWKEVSVLVEWNELSTLFTVRARKSAFFMIFLYGMHMFINIILSSA